MKASVEHAFEVFTDGFDTWWPRSHHIGKSADGEGRSSRSRAGGRCYGREADGTECDWGRVLDMGSAEPVRAGLADHARVAIRAGPAQGQRGRDPLHARSPTASRASISSIVTSSGTATGAANVRAGVDTPNGWGGLLQIYAARATDYHPAVAPLALIFTINDSLASRSFEKVADGRSLAPADRSQQPDALDSRAHGQHARADARRCSATRSTRAGAISFARGASLGSAAGYPTQEADAGRCHTTSTDGCTRRSARLTAADLAQARAARADARDHDDRGSDRVSRHARHVSRRPAGVRPQGARAQRGSSGNEPLGQAMGHASFVEPLASSL